jgi:hypothetical protein
MFKFFVQDSLQYWAFLSSISFETGSELTRIEAGALTGAHLYLVVVPESTSFIAGHAFPSRCAIISARADSDADLSEWNMRRWSGSSDALEPKP